VGTSWRPKTFAARATWRLLLTLAVAGATTLSASGLAFAAVEPSTAAVGFSKKGGEPGTSAAPTPTPKPTPDTGAATTGGKGEGKGGKTPAPTPAPTTTPAPTPDPTPDASAVATPTPAPTTDTTLAAAQTGSCKLTSVVIDANSKQSVLRPGETIGYTVRWQTGGKCSSAMVTWSTDQPGGSFSGSTTGASSATTTFTAGTTLGSNWRITAAVSVKPGNDTKSDSRFVDVKLDSSLNAAPASGRAGTTATLSATLTSGTTALTGRAISFSALGTPLTATTNAAGTATVRLSLAAATAGSFTYTATFAGDAQYRAATATAALIVTPADTTPPVVSATVSGTRGSGEWYVGDVLVSWTVSDPDSAIASRTGCDPASLTADTAAATFECTAASLGGTTTVSVTVARDATRPSIEASRSPANADGWYSADVTVAFSCADALSGVASCSPSVRLAAEGAGQSATGSAQDRAGNTATFTVTGINIDRTAPTVTGSRTPPNSDGWSNGDVVVTFECSDALSGIAECTAPITLSAEGVGQTAAGRARDRAGNVADASVGNVNIDRTPPSIESARTAPNGFGWNSGDVLVSFTCADALSGLVTCSAPVTIAGEGAGQIATGSAADKAGNTATRTVVDINIDRTAPGITGARTAPNAFGWNGADVTVTFTCADALSGIASCSAPIVVATEGADQSASGTGRDRADNAASTTVAGIRIDKTAPTITASRTAANANGWNNGDVTVTFACADTLSGVQSCSAPAVVTAEGAGQSASGSAQDRAGNSASAAATGINIDRTAPTIAGTRTPANATGWNNDDVVVTFACADGLSGVETCGTTAVFGGEGAALSVTRAATDRAGNASSTTVSGVNIDRTKPAIAFSGNAGTYTVAQSVTITCSATDALSGIAGTTCPSVVSEPAYTFATTRSTSVTRAATATDSAGNAASATTSFTVAVSYTSLCELTRSFSTDSLTSDVLCAMLSGAAVAESKGQETAKGTALSAYRQTVQLQIGHAFTSAQATALVDLSKLL
jgi:hypothetical protein